VERALGEVPNVDKVWWDWQNAMAFARFSSGERADEDALRLAVTERTPFTAGKVTYLVRQDELPDALR
jgi:hypothetical protein